MNQYIDSEFLSSLQKFKIMLNKKLPPVDKNLEKEEELEL